MFEHPYGGDNPYGHQSGAAEPIPEGQKILHGIMAELPEEAQTLVDKVSRDIARMQEQISDQVADIREQAERQAAELESKLENRRKALLQHAIEQLEPLQKDLFRSGDLGKALATLIQILTLKARVHNVAADPGSLMGYQQIGKSFYFRVIGTNQGPVWGTDIYTADSNLATAAVHAGAVELGEEGVVKVSIVDMSGVAVRGSMRNGVMTMDWGPYRVGYRVGRG